MASPEFQKDRNMSRNLSASRSDAIQIIVFTFILVVIAFFVHLKYGPFFVQVIWVDRILFVCFGVLLGENSSRFEWLHRKKRQGVLPSETMSLMQNLEVKLVAYCISGYILYKVLGLTIGQGKALLVGLILTFGLVRWELKRIFSTIPNSKNMGKKE
ncbi:MAG: hypothetical protein ABSE89_03040 [Sedimentisphaerales bacterium]